MAQDSDKDLKDSVDEFESETSALKGEGAPPQSDSGLKSSREESFSRRALIRAGWSVPVIMAVTPPRAYAQGSPLPGHSDIIGHSDLVHVDGPHADTVMTMTTGGGAPGGPFHSDVHDDQVGFHGDVIHTDHFMSGHTDSVHSDTPVVHDDTTTHADVGHLDVV